MEAFPCVLYVTQVTCFPTTEYVLDAFFESFNLRSVYDVVTFVEVLETVRVAAIAGIPVNCTASTRTSNILNIFSTLLHMKSPFLVLLYLG